MLHVSLHSCDDMSHLGHPDLVRSSAIVVQIPCCVHGLLSSLFTSTVDRNGITFMSILFISMLLPFY